ncbi:MAG: acyltransferase family protein [Bacteroidales bacterium]|nr:acyltransferase family protein [Bacteroidales bacterium]
MKLDLQITYAKAICILLMVLGHAGVPMVVHRFSCLFHMPLFFFVTGFLFKDDYLQHGIVFFKKKLKSIWWPYVCWTIFSILIHNSVLFPLQIVGETYKLKQILIKIICALGMASTDAYILPGFWFLRDMFYALMMAWPTIKICKMASSPRRQKIGLVLAIALSLLLAVSINLKWLWIPNLKTSALLALSYMLSAYLLKQCACYLKGKHSLWAGIAMLLFMWWLSRYFSTSMTIIQGAGNILLYYLVSMVSVIALLLFCDGLARVEMPWLKYIGMHTMDIFIFHFMAFKLLTYCLIQLKELPMEYMSRFAVPGYWALYTLVGVLVPLGISWPKASCKTWLQGGKEAC